jgi:hypothetical protein
MDNASLLVVAMAEQCSALIEKSQKDDSDLPQAIRPSHLLWMCERIRTHAEQWPATKLHRWIGFVQCGMLANDILDFDGAKSMFDEAKYAYGGSGEDDDLIDHLDPDASFKLDIGGQG